MFHVDRQVPSPLSSVPPPPPFLPPLHSPVRLDVRISDEEGGEKTERAVVSSSHPLPSPPPSPLSISPPSLLILYSPSPSSSPSPSPAPLSSSSPSPSACENQRRSISQISTIVNQLKKVGDPRTQAPMTTMLREIQGSTTIWEGEETWWRWWFSQQEPEISEDDDRGGRGRVVATVVLTVGNLGMTLEISHELILPEISRSESGEAEVEGGDDEERVQRGREGEREGGGRDGGWGGDTTVVVTRSAFSPPSP